MAKVSGILVVILTAVSVVTAKTTFYMDLQSDCSFIGIQYVSSDMPITIYAKSAVDTGSTITACSIDFLAKDNDARIQADFTSFKVQSCDASLYISGDGTGQATGYTCSNYNLPNTYFSPGRSMKVAFYLQGAAIREDYDFVLTISARRDNQFLPPTDANPIGVGLVAGIVVAVFGLIIIISIVGICCFRKYNVRGSSHSPYLYDPEGKRKLDESGSHMSVGVTNESVKNGHYADRDMGGRGTNSSRKKLLAQSESSEEKSSDTSSRLRKNNNGEPIPIPPVPQDKSSSKAGNAVNERAIDIDSKPRNPMLSALNQNAKFRKTYDDTEADADERAKRVSSTSSFEQLGNAPRPPRTDEKKAGSKSTKVKKSKSKSKSNKQSGGTDSESSSELAQIEENRLRQREKEEEDHYDRSEDSLSSNEILSSNTKASKNPNTTHSLRPDRKGGRGTKQQPNPKNPRDRIASAGSVLNDSFDTNGSGRFNKRQQKSPRPQRMGGKVTGFSHRRNRSTDQSDSRPMTPNSMMGSFEDLESLPPLQRASSKTSLYASRSSLYDRRGRRRRGSNGESIVSYARDDMEIMRHSGRYEDFSDEDDLDGYEKPLSRRDRERMYRSETDLGRRMKENSTQTLRETATQTGVEDSVTFQKKKLVKRRRRSRSMSSASTQTKEKKKTGLAKSSTVDQAESTVGDKKPPKVKKSKSVSELDSPEIVKQKPKPKPKPRPRKSESAASHLDEKVKPDKMRSASLGNLADTVPELQGQPEGAPPGLIQGGGYPMPGQFYPGAVGFPQPPPYPGQPGQNYMYQPPQPLPPGMQQPPQPQGFGPGYKQPHSAPRGPRKSNWEMLCELTEGEYPSKEDMTETGSIASSVFTNNVPYPGYGPPPVAVGNQPGYYNPAVPPGYNPNMYPGSQPQGMIQQVPAEQPQQQRVPVVSSSGREQPMNKQKSWEALTAIAGSKTNLTQGHNHRTESIV